MSTYPHGMTTYNLAPVGTSTGTLAVRTGGATIGTVYPLALPGQVPGVAAWVAYWRGLYVGHLPTCGAALAAVVAAQ